MANRNYKAELVSIALQTGWHSGKNIPVLLIGAPGTSKTSFAKQIAQKFSEKLGYDVPFSAFVLPQTRPEELSGVNVPNADRTAVHRLPLKKIKNLCDAKHKKSVALFDELSSGSQQTGAATMTIASDGWAGDVELPNECGKIFCMNPPEQAASGRPLTPPEMNRFCTLKWELPLDDYLNYLRGGPGLLAHIRYLDADWEKKYVPAVKGMIASFLSVQQTLANQLENMHIGGKTALTVEAASEAPWASERSWENMARLVGACMSLGEPIDGELCILATDGCVGSAVGLQFRDWVREMDLPNPEDILANPDKPLPDSVQMPHKMMACLESVAIAALKDHPDKAKRWQTAADKILAPVLKSKPDQALTAWNILIHNGKRPEGTVIPEVAQTVFHINQKTGVITR